MVYVDTNVLIYISVNQGDEKQKKAAKRVRELIKDNKFFISPLTIQEFIFTLAKLKIESGQMDSDVNVYMKHVREAIDKGILSEAYALCKALNYCKNLNDAIHLKMAERYCKKLITFDKDFKKFRSQTKLKIEIMG